MAKCLLELLKTQREYDLQTLSVITQSPPKRYIKSHIITWTAECESKVVVSVEITLSSRLIGNHNITKKKLNLHESCRLSEKLLTQHISGPVTKYKL